MIVADTCLVVHLFNETRLTRVAQKIRETDPYWMLPSLWEEEYANVIAKLARKHAYPTNEVIEHFASVVNQLRDREVSINNEMALRIALERRISVYDAHFIALALDLGTVLVTEDEEILKKCSGTAVSMLHFVQAM